MLIEKCDGGIEYVKRPGVNVAYPLLCTVIHASYNEMTYGVHYSTIMHITRGDIARC